jgi:hypothetical protein
VLDEVAQHMLAHVRVDVDDLVQLICEHAD